MNTYVENINDIIHETSVDFVLRPCAREIHIVQYDKSLPIIKVYLYKEDQPYQLPTNAAVHVRLGKLDNTFIYANILGTNEDRTIAYFEVSEQMAMIAGRVSPVIEVVYQGKVACSSPIPFVIDRNPVQEGQIESHDEFPIIYQLESDVEDHNDWIRRYTALTEFDGFVEGDSVWDDIAEGEIKYCQSGSQTEDVPGENTVIKIDLSQQHLSKAESKALYIKKIIINYTPDGQEEEETYEYTFDSRIFGNGTSSPTIEPLYADLTDDNSGTTLRWYLNYLLAEGVSSYFGNYNGTKGQQFGSNNNPPALISLSTSSLENCTVNSIYVEVSSNSGTKAKCKLTIVNDVWTCDDTPDPQITSDNEEYEWLHEPNGTHLGSSSGGQVIHHYNHVFLKKENGRVSEIQPDETLQYVLNDYSATYKYSTVDNLLHQIGSGGGGGSASFEVLSQVEYNYDSEEGATFITFPKNIMPKVMYLESTNTYLYFDYVNLKVYDGAGHEIQYDDIECNNGHITISLSGDYSVDPEYDYISYDVFDGYDNPLRHDILQVNWWEFYHPESPLPTPTKAGQVLVSNSGLEFEVQDAVPQAENLTAVPTTNDALYSSGPTGGLADIFTGEEAYLQEVKGYSIVWNQLCGDSGTVVLNSSHKYIVVRKDASLDTKMNFVENSSASYDATIHRIYDLTLMFGGNDNIPFSLTGSIEYPVNGTIPQQQALPTSCFSRLFANVNLFNASYDAGTVKNIQVTKLVETGKNLWNANDQDMVDNGLLLLSGYRYEIYLTGNTKRVLYSVDGTWNTNNYINLSRYQRADGKYVWLLDLGGGYRYPNIRIKSYNSSQAIRYVGFVHSGNYCLTTGTVNNQNYATTNLEPPAYTKYEFNVNVSGLNGIPDSSENNCSVYDTVDTTRIGIIDLSTVPVNTTSGGGTTNHYINLTDIPNIDVTNSNFLLEDIPDTVVIVGPYLLITYSCDDHTLSGKMLYKLETPISTGNTFDPIALKDNQDNWIVDDMGSEYFIQPENTNCPVNQVSFYIENLKDKLVNMKNISVISYLPNATPIGGLKIGNDLYRLAPLGTTSSGTTIYSSSLAIGQGSGATANNSVAIGNGAHVSGQNSYGSVAIGASSNVPLYYGIAIGYTARCGSSNNIAIGYSSYPTAQGAIAIGSSTNASGENSIAIGYLATNKCKDTVCFDATNRNTTYQCYDPSYIFFRNENVASNKVGISSYTKGHYLDEYVTNKSLTLQDGKYYVAYTDSSNYKTFKTNCVSGTATDITSTVTGVHITIVLADDMDEPTWHSVVGLDLLLYDTDNDMEYQSYGRVDCGGTAKDISAYVDSDGCVVITPPSDSVIINVKYNIR